MHSLLSITDTHAPMCFCGNCGSVLQLGWHGDTYREFRCKIGQLLRYTVHAHVHVHVCTSWCTKS